jgi:hypothetical protein
VSLPSPVNRAVAVAAVETFFAAANWRERAEEYGWAFAMLDPLTPIVTLTARRPGTRPEVFTLRLACDYYPSHPPDVRFVNPATYEYDPEKDLIHVAKLQAPYCHVHVKFSYPHPYRYGPQLVCSSVALGYYFSDHTPTPEQAWDPSRHTIGFTVHTVQRALNSYYFLGRHDS